MKTHHHHQKLKTQPRPLFSCGFFRNCTQSSSLSPTTPHPPPLPLNPPPPPPPPPPPRHNPPPSSSSSSSSTSQSFTQWKFPIPTSPLRSDSSPPRLNHPPPPPPPLPIPFSDLQELFHVAELQLTTGSESEQVNALYLLERSLVPNPPNDPTCPAELMRGIVLSLKKNNSGAAKSATKVLLALCLAEGNRRVAVEAGAVGAVVEAVAELEGSAAERALAALELMCTVAEGAAELRAHALAVPVMVAMMGQLAGRGREYAISVISVIYSGSGGGEEGVAVVAPAEEVARAVALALQGQCTARGRRKGTQLLKTLQDYDGRLDLSHNEKNERR